MKDHTRCFPRLASLLFLTPTLICPSAAAQSTSPSGTFGFLANASQIDSNGSNGGAFLGVLTFDVAGNVTRTTILQTRNTNSQNAQAISSSLTGTYSSNPDGTITLALALDIGLVYRSPAGCL